MYNFNRPQNISSTTSRRTRRRETKKARSPERRRARFEFLEDRRVLAVLTVNSVGDAPADTSALTLRDAITLVNNTGDPSSLGQSSMPAAWASQITGAFGSNDTVQFDPNLFGPTQQTVILSGGELSVRDNLAIAGPGPAELAISGNNASPVMEVGYFTVSANISGLTIENGVSTDAVGDGGGISNSYDNLTLSNVVVSQNRSELVNSGGGGIANSGTLTLINCTVTGNTSSGGGGGGIESQYGALTIRNSTISGNTAADGGGGIQSIGTLTISNSTISGNTAGTAGGGIDAGEATLIDSTVSGNSVPNPVWREALPSAFDDGTGGGINCLNLAVNGCTIADNTAYAGGGIAGNGQLTVRNSTISSNVASDADGPSGSLQGGGILTGGTFLGHTVLSIENSIVAGNTSGDVTYIGRSVNVVGDNLIGTNPMLGPLQDNGGATPTMLPLPGSPAIDAGNATTLTVSTDQRGFGRIVGGGLDFGAVESGAAAAVSDLAISGQAPATANWGGEITYTLTVTNNGPSDQSDVTAIDVLPDNATLVSWQQTSGAGGWSLAAPAVGGGGTVTAWAASLASGASATFALVLKHNPVTVYGYVAERNVVNSASVGPLTGDPVAANNSLSFTTSMVDVPTSTSVVVEGDGISADGSSVVGEPRTIDATVTSVLSSGIGMPSGTVTFYDNGLPIGAATFDGWNGYGEQASLTAPLLSAGNHSITAEYTSGDAIFAASAPSAAVSVAVRPAITLTTVTSTAGRSTAAFGQNVTFTANVSVVAPGAGAPTGTVQFQVDGQNVGNPVPLNANDQASISGAAIPIGNHRVTAVYSGDSNFHTSSGLLPGTISTIAGSGGLYTLPSPAKAAVLYGAAGIAVDPAGDMFIPDFGSNSIRKVDAKTGVISAVGGAPVSRGYYDQYQEDLVGMLCDASGDLFYSDPGNNVVEKLSPNGMVTTVAGMFGSPGGYGGYSGDGGPATAAQLSAPSGLALDAAGDLFIVDELNSVVREVTPNGIITTVAGGGSPVYPSIGDGGAATAASLLFPTGIAVNAAGDLFIADTGDLAVRKVDHATGMISTVLNFDAFYSTPQGLAFDAAGDLFIADGGNDDILEVSTGGAVTTFAGTSGNAGYSGDGGPAADALLGSPTGLAMDAGGNLFVADSGDGVIREVNSTGIINTVAGGGHLGTTGNGGPAIDAPLGSPANLAVDSAGNLFIADSGNSVVREVSPAGIITTVAGNGIYGYSGDGGSATAAQLSTPNGLALDAAGDLFIADAGNNVVRKVTPAGIISNFAGNGAAGYSGDGGSAADASLHLSGYYGLSGAPLAIDAQGDLFIGDDGNGVIREVSAAGVISTISLPATFNYGTTSLTTADYFGANAGSPGIVTGLAVDAVGNLFIASNSGNFRGGGGVLELNQAGKLSVFAGAPYFSSDHSTDGGSALGAPLSAGSLAFDAAGNLLIVDLNDFAIRSVSPAGIITTVAGGAPIFDSNGNYISYSGNGDGGPATSVPLYYPAGVAVDAAGDLFTSEGSVIRKVSPSLVVTKDATTTTVAPSTAAPVFGQPMTFTISVAADAPGAGTPTGTVQLVVDGQNFGSPLTLNANDTASLTTAALAVGIHTITAVYSGNAQFQVSAGVLANGTIKTVVGTGIAGYTGDGGPAISAQLNKLPEGLAFDSAGNLYIADLYNQVVRKVSTNGTITTVAGNGTDGYSGDGGLATAAQLDLPFDVAVDSLGDLFIDDCVNNVIREVFPNGIITTVAGNGTGGYSGDEGYATDAELYRPSAIALDPFGDLFIADGLNHVVREVTPDGIIHTVAGNGTAGNSGDGGSATAAEMYSPNGIAVDALGDLFISDYWENVIREVTPDGIIHTIAGNGFGGGTGGGGYSGDGGSATAAELFNPEFIRLDAAGDLFISDGGNNVVREVRAGIITTVAGNGAAGYTGDGGPATAAELGAYPAGLAVDANGDLFIADATNNVIREVTPTLIVSQAGTATTLASSNSSSPYGQSVTFTATVAVVAPGAGAPTGTVTFWDGATQLATVALNAAGQATFTTSKLSVATHTITAVYSGDTNFSTSTSAALRQSVMSAQQEIAGATSLVQALVTSGVVNQGNGNALVSKLNNAMANLNGGNTTAGVNQLNAFINQVKAFVNAHKLGAADAQTLIADATAAITAAVNAKFA